MKYAWIEQYRDSYPVTMMCELLGVSRSGAHAARVRSASTRVRTDAQLTEEIRRWQRKHRGRYGRRRMRREVSTALGWPVNEKRVARLMRQNDLQSRQRRRFRVVTTDSKHAHPVAPNVLARDFAATAPNQKWLADLTYVPTAEGWLYLALILDLFSRKFVGWAMSDSMAQDLTVEALQMALGWRDPLAGLTHHSDRGSQYAAGDYPKVLAARGINVSMSRKGDCWDNAPMESANGTVKVECVQGAKFKTRAEAAQALPTLDRARYAPAKGVARGAYVLADADGDQPEVLLLASGSEVALCIAAYDQLKLDGVKARVVSMPSWDLFERQDKRYREHVLPEAVRARVSVEAASALGWDRYVGRRGEVIAMRSFGLSAPGKVVEAHFGFDVAHVVAAARRQLGRHGKEVPV